MNKTLYKLILPVMFISLIVTINTAHAVQFDDADTKVDLPVLSTPNNAITPRISADDSGHVYVVWSDNRGGPYKVYINTKFSDSGWSPRSVPINTGFPKDQGATQDGDATAPQVCSDNSGHVYVVWSDDRSVLAGTGKKDIYFRYSNDFGNTWFAPDQYTDYRIDSDNPNAGNSIAPEIACDENGNVYILWQDDRNKQGTYEVYFRSLQVEFSKPVDFIVPYQTPELRVNTGVTAGIFQATNPVMSADKNGTVYVAWQDTRNIPEDSIYHGIYFNVSRNHGITWKPNSIRIDNAPAGLYVSLLPVISNDNNGSVYVAWLDNAGRVLRGDRFISDSTFDVYFNVSNDFGNTWGVEDKRIDTPTPDTRIDARHVSVANNNKGVVIVAWSDNTFGEEVSGTKSNFNIFSSHSENFGRSFIDAEANIRLDLGVPAGYTNAARPSAKIDDSGNAFVVWTDNRGDKNDIFFNFSISNGEAGSWVDYDYWLDNVSPYGNSYNPAMAIDNHGHVYIAWQDDRSALVRDNYNIYFIGGFLDVEKLLLAGQRLGEACFIATAAYGSPFEKHVALLREFRDKYLLTNRYGEWFVETYYRLSPTAAQFISGHPYLKPVVRVVLLPFVGVAVMALKIPFLHKLLMALSMTIVLLMAWRKLKTR